MSSDRDRQRLHRAREREGKAILPVEVSLYDLTDALVVAGFIQAWDCDSRDRIRDDRSGRTTTPRPPPRSAATRRTLTHAPPPTTRCAARVGDVGAEGPTAMTASLPPLRARKCSNLKASTGCPLACFPT